jgi:hypothetical protein
MLKREGKAASPPAQQRDRLEDCARALSLFLSLSLLSLSLSLSTLKMLADSGVALAVLELCSLVF